MEAATTPINWELESEGWRKRYHQKDNENAELQQRIKELEEWMEDLKLIFTPKQPIK